MCEAANTHICADGLTPIHYAKASLTNDLKDSEMLVPHLLRERRHHIIEHLKRRLVMLQRPRRIVAGGSTASPSADALQPVLP